MTIAIHQPNYIPWLGYFYKIFQADKFVFLDDVQFARHGAQNYHYIKTPQGSFRLKIPVASEYHSLINEIETRDELEWRQKHLKTVEMNYRKAPYFDEIFHDLKYVLNTDVNNLSNLNIKIISFICHKFGMTTSFVNSSDLQIKSSKEEKIMDICQTLEANVYYSGTGAKAYQSEEQFIARGIELKYSSFKTFEYPQMWGSFLSNVSVIDYLMNCGYDWDRVLNNQEQKL